MASGWLLGGAGGLAAEADFTLEVDLAFGWDLVSGAGFVFATDFLRGAGFVFATGLVLGTESATATVLVLAAGLVFAADLAPVRFLAFAAGFAAAADFADRADLADKADLAEALLFFTGAPLLGVRRLIGDLPGHGACNCDGDTLTKTLCEMLGDSRPCFSAMTI